MTFQEIQEGLRSNSEIPQKLLPHHEEVMVYKQMVVELRRLVAELKRVKGGVEDAMIRNLNSSRSMIIMLKMLLRLTGLPPLNILKKHRMVFESLVKYINLVKSARYFLENAEYIQGGLSSQLRSKNLKRVQEALNKVLEEDLSRNELKDVHKLSKRLRAVLEDHAYYSTKSVVPDGRPRPSGYYKA